MRVTTHCRLLLLSCATTAWSFSAHSFASAARAQALVDQRAFAASAAPTTLAPSDDYLSQITPSTNRLSRAFCGTYFGVIALVTVVTIYPPLVLPAAVVGRLFDYERRRLSDWVVGIWARLTMMIFFAKVVVEGTENLPPDDEPTLYAPNHCSFLDIFALSGYLPRRFKYVSKVEILRIPFIGWAMGFAKHIAIARADRASQMKTLKDAVDSLKAGNSLVTFPEGTRSVDGTLGPFKKGPFTMASRAGVRVVPISIVGTHLFQPPGAFVPLAFPRGVRIIVHPPLDTPQKKKEDASMRECRAAVLSGLPPAMQPEGALKAAA